MSNYELFLTNGQKINHTSTIKENVVFTEWLKKENVYDKFIKIADLPKLSNEKEPALFFTSLDWDKIEKNKDEESYWNSTLDAWIIFISKREWGSIVSGIESNDKYKQELFNRKVIEKLNNIDFNKLSNEQYKKLDVILK